MDVPDLQTETRRGIALARRGGIQEDPKLILEAVAVFRAVLEATPDGHEDLATYRSNLGNALRALAEPKGDVKTLREAADVHRSAVDVAQDSPNRTKCLFNLSNCLQILYENTGELDDLAEALEAGNEVIRFTPPDDPQFATRSGSRGIAARLLAKAHYAGAELSLPLALAGLEAAESLSADNQNFAGIHTNLGNALHAIHGRTGDVLALRKAVQAHRTALAATPEGDPQRASALSNLGNALSAFYERTGAIDDLTEAVEVCRQAVAASTAREDFIASLTNLSTALQQRYERTGDLATINEAVEAGRAAAKLLHRVDPNRPTAEGAFKTAVTMQSIHLGTTAKRRRRGRPSSPAELNNYSLALKVAYESTGKLGLLKKAAKASRAAVATTPAEHPDGAGHRCNLAQILEQLAEHTGNTRLVAEALDQFREAGATQSATPAIRIMALRQIPRLAQTPEEGLAAMVAAVGLLPDVAPRTLRRTDREYQVARLGNLAAESAAAALNAARADLAVDLMEKARGLLTTQVVHRRLDTAGGEARALAKDDRVVFLAASAQRCDAVIVSGDPQEQPVVVPLTDVTEEECLDQAMLLMAATVAISDGHEGPAARRAAQSQVLDVLAWLWDAVTEPVLTALGHTGRPNASWPRLWWCPVGIFAYLPLHAAGHHTDLGMDDLAFTSNPRTVLDRVVSSYIPTLRSLRYARSQHSDAVDGPVLVVAAPDALPDQKLPAFEAAELPALRRLFPLVSLLADPSRDSVLAALPHHRIAHFSCHGQTDQDDPSRSHLVLPDHKTAPLTVTDIADLHLNSGLAFLSACETTLAKIDFADEALHLTGAFHLAGYRHVIGTLWPISDYDASAFATDFYTHLTADGTCPPNLDHCAIAAHHATRRLRERYPAAPTAWAGYIHTGC